MTVTNRQPTQRRWATVATEEALAGGVDPVGVMAGVQEPAVIRARHRAFRRLAEDGFCFAGIGRASGFHHTTVLGALRRTARWKDRSAR